ncbi:hypothetical protein HNR49_002343 [Halobacterium salinarum]|uniref:YapH protein n=3 Tax=Halobacteriales TaxID=2235 RepID=B0R8T9_HALS3|nr:hypothetical protein [Halobacterium salinarum]CAP15125.1 uncharacterized protein OE_7143R [Halobacterium salinarum R1]CAP15365.1 uncharacterized protein OE_6263R [Halobacterium salinarum R1]
MWTGPAIVVVKTVILLLGSGITYIAYKAYRRTGTPSLRALGIGFGVITFGALLAGIAHQILSVSLELGILINSVLVAIGLAIIMYSLYLERR